jgi:hypothetical protein
MTPRPELFDDVAGQLERLEPPLNHQWREQQVSREEAHALSRSLALIVRGYCALTPIERSLFITQGVFCLRDGTTNGKH